MSQESYHVLARKYRPSNFDELVGQDALVTTVRNSIRNNKIHHAFVLTGIRGIGKTTTARIIAKALNCQDKINGTDPCGKCSSCLAIARSNHQDVIEIDAASRTGVDDIREIIDNIGYAPVELKYKIYIIDEVHMLSNNAFNALLKTLEEPPAFVVFIFATTEIHKVPVTVISRCMRFDLARLSNDAMEGHLKNILKLENYQAQDKAISLIAAKSQGSVRDALSLLDSALSFCNYENEITVGNLLEIIGVVDKEVVVDFLVKIFNGDVKEVLCDFDDLYRRFVDVNLFLDELMDVVHRISLSKTLKESYQDIDLTENAFNKVKNVSEKITVAALCRVWQMLLKLKDEIAKSKNSKMIFEMFLIRLCHLSSLPNLSEIIKNQPSGFDQKSSQDSNNDQSKEVVDEVVHLFKGSKIIN